MISTRLFDLRTMMGLAAMDIWGDDAPSATRIALVTNDFTEDKNLVKADFDMASFTGSTPKVVPFGQQTMVIEQITERLGIKLNEPLGGLDFVCSDSPASPETITGYIVYDTSQLFAMHRFDEDQVVTELGDFVAIPSLFGFANYELFTGPQNV